MSRPTKKRTLKAKPQINDEGKRALAPLLGKPTTWDEGPYVYYVFAT